jgi:hypothetical protein
MKIGLLLTYVKPRLAAFFMESFIPDKGNNLELSIEIIVKNTYYVIVK